MYTAHIHEQKYDADVCPFQNVHSLFYDLPFRILHNALAIL